MCAEGGNGFSILLSVILGLGGIPSKVGELVS